MPATETSEIKAAETLLLGMEPDNPEKRVWEDQDDWSEIRYSIHDSSGFQEGTFGRKTIKKDKPRVIGIFARRKGEDTATLQSLRFPKDDGWTMAKAKEWVKDHPDIKSLPLEETPPKPSVLISRPMGFEGFRRYPLTEIRLDSETPPKLVGHAAVFNRLSVEFSGFRERVNPGAFRKTLIEADIHAFWNHNSDIVLGRAQAGTLELHEDDIGLAIINKPPDTQLVRDMVLTPIRRGEVDQMSFAFRVPPGKESWAEEDGMLIRTLQEVQLYEVSYVPKGAYLDTDVALRELAGAQPIMDFFILARAITKAEHNLPLTAEEIEALKESIRTLTRQLPAEPSLAAHSGESTPQPLQRETLRRRLKRCESRLRR